MKKKLYARATTGKTKFIEIEADGDYLITRWGYVDGKQQETREKCEPKNVGKANETTGQEQAILKLERKIEKKMNSGYVEKKDFSKTTGTEEPNLTELQKEFCPCKPIAKPPKDALNGDYLADRKYNGVNIILTKNGNGSKRIYTRRMDDITEQLLQLKELSDVFEGMEKYSMLLVELTYFDNGDEVPEKLRGLINKRRTKEKVLEYYNTLNGRLIPVVFDVMFWKKQFVGDRPFTTRRGIIREAIRNNVPIAKKFSLDVIQEGKKENWEGFILRKPDSKITYTMNGKAKRTGSWKWKYEETDDFIVTDAVYGKGKHDNYFARFNLAQYDKKGNLIDVGWCGPGRLKVVELEYLHKERSNVDGSYKVKPYMVVEVLYRVRTKDGKLEFPVLQRIRDDKRAKECIYND